MNKEIYIVKYSSIYHLGRWFALECTHSYRGDGSMQTWWIFKPIIISSPSRDFEQYRNVTAAENLLDFVSRLNRTGVSMRQIVESLGNPSSRDRLHEI